MRTTHKRQPRRFSNRKSPSDNQKSLFKELQDRLPDVKIEMEKWDGHKSIDIAIVRAKLNIEVDGVHHNLSYKQALSDMKREYYSMKKGYYTLHVPNSIFKDENVLGEISDLISDIVKDRVKARQKNTIQKKDLISNKVQYKQPTFFKILKSLFK